MRRRPMAAAVVSLSALAAVVVLAWFALVSPADARPPAEGLAAHFAWVCLPLPVPRAFLRTRPDE